MGQVIPSAEELVIVSRSCVASFVFTIYDYLLTLADEVEIIWPKPNNSWVKWKFLFLRYFALATQFMNIAMDLRVISRDDVGLRSTVILGLLVAQLVACLLLSIIVESILMTRVYALYNKNVYIAVVCVSSLVVQVVTMFVGIAKKAEGRHAISDTVWETLSGSFPYFL
ncbi:hypothetical protein AX15_002188 [Amanita polypyramis BW_CC]|nr:hypothetical protein AX15_002188 [Amanita polypyramis BW_CC]